MNNDCQNMPLIQAVNKASLFLLDSDTGSFEEKLFAAMGVMAAATDVDRVYIWKNHMISGVLHCTQIYEWSDNVTPQQNNELTVDIPYSDVAPDWEEILSQDKCINGLVRNMADETKDHLTAQGIISILVVPVFLQGSFWGFVGFDDCHKERLFSSAEEMVLRSSGLLFAHAYQKNEMLCEIEKNNELNLAALSSAPIGLAIFDENFCLYECNGAMLRIFENMEKYYFLEHFFELSPESQADGMNSKEKAHSNFLRALGGENVKTEWMHRSPNDEPIPCEVTLVGAKIGDKQVVLWYAYDLRRIKKLQMDLDIAKKEMHIDSLTGIYNRRYFDETLPVLIHMLSRCKAHLSVLMLDIDHFKKYNDTYGHLSGDDCLRKVAMILQKSQAREEDFIARYGGEEFVIVLPSTDEHGALFIAEKILKLIRAANILHEQSPIADRVTLSIGIASSKTCYTQTKEAYTKLADEALYTSKREGRDRYTFKALPDIRR